MTMEGGPLQELLRAAPRITPLTLILPILELLAPHERGLTENRI